MIFKCTCGKKIKYGNPEIGSYNVGAAIKTTGWVWLPTADGSDVWLCKSCGARAKELAKELFGILRTRYAHIPSLLKKVDEDGLFTR